MNLPNALTWARIFLVPFLVVVLLTPISENWLNTPRWLAGLTIFVVASLTDYFDGSLARRLKQTSKFGKTLDTIADKLLISAALISLVEHHVAPGWAVVTIIAREFAVTGLREQAASGGEVISPSIIGKLKMWAQVFTVGFLILSLSPTGDPPQLANFGQPFPAIMFWTVPELRMALAHLSSLSLSVITWGDCQVLFYTIGRAMLWVAVILAVYSMAGYFKTFGRELFGSPAKNEN